MIQFWFSFLLPSNHHHSQDHGFGTARAGTLSVINNGWKTIYAGNLVCWQFPAAPFHPKGDVYNFNGGETTNYLARYGVPTTQFRPEYVPFDPTDFSVQMAAAFAAMTTPHEQGGVSNIPFPETLPNVDGAKNKVWSGIQDEATSYKNGFWGIGLTLVETLIRHGLVVAAPGLNNILAEIAANPNFVPPSTVSSQDARRTGKKIASAIGLFKTVEEQQTLTLEGIADILLQNISPEDTRKKPAMDRFTDGLEAGKTLAVVSTQEPNDEDAMYDRLRVNLTEVFTNGVSGSWLSKTSKIVGKAMNRRVGIYAHCFVSNFLSLQRCTSRHDACHVWPFLFVNQVKIRIHFLNLCLQCTKSSSVHLKLSL